MPQVVITPQIEEKLAALLKSAGFSYTKPRQTIFRTLAQHGALTMHELHTYTKTELDRASTYRTISLFEKLRITVRVPRGWKYVVELSDVFQPHHHHLTCTQCHRSIALHDEDAIEQLVSRLSKQHTFIPSKHEVEIEGLCADCQKS